MLYDGKYYGVLMMAYGMMFYYNDKLLADAKVAVPRTSDELLKAITATTDANAGSLRLGRADDRASERRSSRSARG